jgi:hypothetical protein
VYTARRSEIGDQFDSCCVTLHLDYNLRDFGTRCRSVPLSRTVDLDLLDRSTQGNYRLKQPEGQQSRFHEMDCTLIQGRRTGRSNLSVRLLAAVPSSCLMILFRKWCVSRRATGWGRASGRTGCLQYHSAISRFIQ